MTLDPQCQAILEAAARGRSVFDARNPAEARRLYAATTERYAPPTPKLARVEDRRLPGPDGSIPVRVYTPVAEGGPEGLPVLVYFHGGGWVFGDLDTHDALCRAVAHAAACLVISVDYRLAPEHRFPAGLMDCLAATRWCAEHGRGLGADPTRLAVGGDSAGGNLAAAVTHLARDGGPPIVFQWLVYPAVDFTADNDSLRENGEDYLLTRAALEWARDQYLSHGEEARDPRASPALAADLSALPPALVQTAEYDPLRDEGEAYAHRLAAAGVAVETIRYPGMIHGFIRMGALIDRARTAIEDGARALRRAFGT